MASLNWSAHARVGAQSLSALFRRASGIHSLSLSIR